LAQGDKTVRAATANTRTTLGEPDKAIPLWQELLRAFPGDLRYLAGLGRSLNLARRYGETRRILGTALRESHSPTLARIVAEADAALGTSADALQAAELGLKKDPKDFQLLRAAAESAESTVRPEEAGAYSRRALAVNPQSIPLHETLGRSLIERKDFEEARAFFQSMVQGNDVQDAGLRGLLTVAQETDDVKGGYRTALALREARPADPGIALKYAIAAAGDKRFATAYRVLRPMAAPSRGNGVLALYYPEVLDTTAAGKVPLAPVARAYAAVARARGDLRVPGGFPGGARENGPDPAVLCGDGGPLRHARGRQGRDPGSATAGRKPQGRQRPGHARGGRGQPGRGHPVRHRSRRYQGPPGHGTLVPGPHRRRCADDSPRQRGTGPVLGPGQVARPGAWRRTPRCANAWRQRLRRLRNEAGDLPIEAWLYPGGLAPDDLINVTPGQRQAYRDAVAAFFPVALTTSP